MKKEILNEGSFPVIRFELADSEQVYAESGAMISMSPHITVEGKLRGGVLGSLVRKVFTGETFFFQTLKAQGGSGEAILAPSMPGELAVIEMDGSVEYRIQKDGFLAATEGITLKTTTQGLTQGLFSGEGFFILSASGSGSLVVSSFGSIIRREVAAGQEWVVDNGHLVAWSSSLSYEITKSSGGWISSLTSGEALVCRFKGPGSVWIQTRNPGSFGQWLSSYIPSKG